MLFLQDNQSYGLRLISRSQIADKDGCGTTGSDKENIDETPPTQASPKQLAQPEHRRRRTSLHIRNLSPIDIVTLSTEKVNEPNTARSSQDNFKLPNTPTVTDIKENKNLRRSLFKQPTPIVVQPGSPDLTLRSSTPMLNIRNNVRTLFFQDRAGNDIGNLSPIQAKGKTSSKNNLHSLNYPGDDLDGVELIEQIKEHHLEKRTPVKIAHLNSLAAIENDLKIQYDINQKTPTRKSLRTPQKDQTRIPAQDKIVSQDMDIDSESISQYRRQLVRRLSSHNQTDLNAICIVETPVAQTRMQKKLLAIDPILAKKLKECEETMDTSQILKESPNGANSGNISDGELTGDEEILELPVEIPEATKRSKKKDLELQNKSKPSNVKKAGKRRELKPSKESSGTEIIQERTCESEVSNSKRDDIFLRPKAPLKQVTADSDTSITKVIPLEILQSFRNLSKRRNDDNTEGSLQDQNQITINAPAKKRKTSTSNLTTNLKLVPKKRGIREKQKEGSKGKRTLYSDVNEGSLSSHSQEDPAASEQVENAEISSDKESDEIKSNPKNKQKKVFKKPQRKNIKEVEDNENSGSKENGEDHDEEFSSDLNSSTDNVRWNPYERGCQRPGLRIRRFFSPWWVNSGKTDSYGIVFDGLSAKESKAEAALKKEMQKRGIKGNQFLTSAVENCIYPTEKLKLLKQTPDIKPPKKSKSVASKASKKLITQTSTSSVQATSETNSLALSKADSFYSLIQSIGDASKPGTSKSKGKIISCEEFGKFYNSNLIL